MHEVADRQVLGHNVAMNNDFRAIRCALSGMEAVVASSSHSFARHTHDQFGFGVIERGGQLWRSRRGEVEAGPGSVISVSPGEVHDGDPVGSAGRTWSMLYVDPALVAHAASGISHDAGASFEVPQPAIQSSNLYHHFEMLFRAVTTGANDMRCEELLLTLLARIGNHRKADVPIPMHPQVAQARALIDDDPCSAISLSDLAELGDLSRFQILRSFKSAVGLTPHAYLVQRRIELAKRLITSGNTLAHAAVSSGFADQSHMTRAFISRYGLRPGSYARVARPHV